MDSREYESAANYWIEKDAASKHMPREKLGEAIDAFLAAHNTCALATGAGSFVRNTPLEYNYFDGEIWIFSEGGLKFKALAQNKNVCLAIFDAYGAAPLVGMQIMGTAELVEDWSEEYVRLLERKGINAEAFKKSGHALHLLHIVPSSIDFLNSSFKEQGYSSRQHLSF